VKLLGAIEGAGEDLAGIYHSHTKTEAYPSQTDVNLARGWPDPLWFICSLVDTDAPVVRAFAIRDGAVDEVELEVG
jgi:proteasome lid subunit RPN8/RPN11